MIRKFFQKIWPELKLLPWALLLAVPLMFLFAWFTGGTEESYWVGYILSVIGFYLVRLGSWLAYRMVPKVEEWISD